MILQAESVDLSYGARTVAERLDFSVERAAVISIIGPNGSGKSTLLKALGRLLKPARGTVLLDGKDIHQMKPWEVARKMAILPQSAAAPGDMTVCDLVCCGRMPYQSLFSPRQESDMLEIDSALRATGMLGMKYRRLDSLSGGERQRAWIALAIAQQPEILLLDEPTTYLDIHHQLELMHLVARLHEQLGITVIMVMHDLNHAARFSHRLVAVQSGRIVADGDVEEIFTAQTLRKLYGVETSVMRVRQGSAEHLVCFPHGICLLEGA